MSLQSTYQSRKALLVENLETMGVTGYDETDGLTTLINAVLEIGPTPPTPTPASLDLSLTAGKQILSYADVGSGTEYATFTATVLDQNDDPLPGVSVSIYKDNVLWYTAETGAGGTISKTYDSEGVGDVSFHAVCGSFVTERFVVRDVHYYANYDKIKSTWTKETSVSGRTIYNYLNAVGNTTVEFKLKNTVPTSYLVGIGKFYNGGQIKSMVFNNNGTTKHWYSTGSGGNENKQRSVSATITSNTVFKFIITNTNTISFYVDDVLIATDNCRSDFGNTLRIDDFTSTPLDLDYVIVV